MTHLKYGVKALQKTIENSVYLVKTIQSTIGHKLREMRNTVSKPYDRLLRLIYNHTIEYKYGDIALQSPVGHVAIKKPLYELSSSICNTTTKSLYIRS